MKRIVSSLLVFAAAAGSLCGASGPQEARRDGVEAGSGVAPRSVGRADDERAIREAIEAFTQAFQKGDAPALAGLFTEDAGRHDPIMNIGWPASEGNAYYSGLLSDPDCLLLLARHDSASAGTSRLRTNASGTS